MELNYEAGAVEKAVMYCNSKKQKVSNRMKVSLLFVLHHVHGSLI